jgi:hypothetical protein
VLTALDTAEAVALLETKISGRLLKEKGDFLAVNDIIDAAWSLF